jgi:hypothetical protein
MAKSPSIKKPTERLAVNTDPSGHLLNTFLDLNNTFPSRFSVEVAGGTDLGGTRPAAKLIGGRE